MARERRVEEHSERYKYEDLIAWNINIEIYNIYIYDDA